MKDKGMYLEVRKNNNKITFRSVHELVENSEMCKVKGGEFQAETNIIYGELIGGISDIVLISHYLNSPNS